MTSNIATKIVEDFEQGRISRRQLVSRLMGLGAAMAVLPHVSQANQQDGGSTFQATGLDHIALTVSNVPRSRDFYVEHLGLQVSRDSEESCFLNFGNNFLALFRGDSPGLNHYCYAIQGYNPDQAVEKLSAVGLEPRRVANRVYFNDPDGIRVQVAGS